MWPEGAEFQPCPSCKHSNKQALAFGCSMPEKGHNFSQDAICYVSRDVRSSEGHWLKQERPHWKPKLMISVLAHFGSKFPHHCPWTSRQKSHTIRKRHVVSTNLPGNRNAVVICIHRSTVVLHVVFWETQTQCYHSAAAPGWRPTGSWVCSYGWSQPRWMDTSSFPGAGPSSNLCLLCSLGWKLLNLFGSQQWGGKSATAATDCEKDQMTNQRSPLIGFTLSKQEVVCVNMCRDGGIL